MYDTSLNTDLKSLTDVGTSFNTDLKSLTDVGTSLTDAGYGDINYTFSLFGDDEFGHIEELEDLKHISTEVNWKTCTECMERMYPMKSSYRCLRCGRDVSMFEQEPEFSTTIADNYNSNTTCSVSIKITGKNSYKYHKALLRTSSDYSKVQSTNTNKQLHRFNSQCSEGKLPISILKESAELYGTIQQHNIVRRGRGRVGVLGACISFVCDMHGITKKPKEIASFLQIEEAYLSKGDKLLRRLHAESKIDIPVYHNPKNAYIIQYFEALQIDNKYKNFVSDIVDRASQVDMVGENNSRTSTKCAGVIYLLKVAESLTFSKSDIMRYCHISKSTFIRYYDFLFRNKKKLKPIFIEYKVSQIHRAKK
jgi:transcription initiation factor TFIIIB Brf1 subunit/transcription initiation factor TFIIB